MKLGILGLIFLSLLATAFAAGPTAKFVFTTEPQTIASNELSVALTIQSQDASGEKTNTTETIDLEFSSTSQTGEFLNSSGNPVGTVMNKNTANRTFYYRDSAPGTFTLTVRAVGRETGATFEASQQIVVSDGEGGQSGAQESQSGSLSKPVGQSVPTLSPPKFSAKILGGDKTVILGAQVNFEAVLFGLEGKPIETADFFWTFGDGTTARGRLANNTYNYPGKYIVYFNVSISGASLSDSITVNIVPNEILISEVKPGSEGWAEIFNGSGEKMEISHWAISNGREAFYFPKNTFIDSKTHLIIPKEVSGIEFFSTGTALLLYPRGDIAHELAYSGGLRKDESFHAVNGDARAGIESPGNGRFVARVNTPSNQGGQSLALTTAVKNSVSGIVELPEGQLAAVGVSDGPAKGSFRGNVWTWFGVALVLGVLSAVGFLFIKAKGFF